MGSKTEGKRAGEAIMSLANGDRSLEEITVLSGQDLDACDIVGRLITATAAADAGNTGDGTMSAVTVGADVEIGVYTLTITGLGTTLSAAAAAADGGNTGDGTVSAPTAGTQAEVGTYTIECTSAGPGVAASGTSAAVAGNTGDGTMTASPATGANAKVGTYNIICIGAATDSGEFLVTDPDGIELGVATVGSEFTAGTHLTFTISDGGTDFAVGDAFTVVVAAADSGTFKVVTPSGIELANRATVGVAYDTDHLDFTISDGATDFVVGDKFTVAVTQVNSGVFEVETPSGVQLQTGTVGVAYGNDHLGFTLSDGATDFAVDDVFTITTAEGKIKVLAPAATDGTQIAHGMLFDDVDASSADKQGVVVNRDAELNTNLITWPTGATAAQKTTATAQLKARGVLICS